MRHRFLKSVLTFLLTLVLTIGTVAALSMATAAKTETASTRYSQEVRKNRSAAEVTELSASVPEEGVSPLRSAGAFALILLIPVTGGCVFLQARRKGRGAAGQTGRRYSPRADRTFRADRPARTRV